jgi:hypothetical protein
MLARRKFSSRVAHNSWFALHQPVPMDLYLADRFSAVGRVHAAYGPASAHEPAAQRGT